MSSHIAQSESLFLAQFEKANLLDGPQTQTPSNLHYVGLAHRRGLLFSTAQGTPRLNMGAGSGDESPACLSIKTGQSLREAQASSAAQCHEFA